MSLEEIPLYDLAGQQAEVSQEIQSAFDEIVQTSAFVNGPAVAAFERAYAEFVGVRHCVGVGNGTDALELSIRAAGIGPDDEVILPANSFVATAEAVVRAGATPVLVDCDPTYQLLDVAQVADQLTSRTRAVMPVHLYGQVAPMAALRDVLGGRDEVLVLEDAAQSQGALQEGQSAGSFGLAAGTSFYPGKNLGAYGDAGAVLSNDDRIAGTVRLLRDHGSRVKYEHEIVGYNSRLDSLQAAVLSAKLRCLPRWNKARDDVACRYDELLGGVEQVTLPHTLPGNLHVWHLYVIRVAARDRIAQCLAELGVHTGIHYPVPIHLQPAFRALGQGLGTFPVAEAAAQEVLSLPMYPHLGRAQQERVAETLARVCARL